MRGARFQSCVPKPSKVWTCWPGVERGEGLEQGRDLGVHAVLERDRLPQLRRQAIETIRLDEPRNLVRPFTRDPHRHVRRSRRGLRDDGTARGVCRRGCGRHEHWRRSCTERHRAHRRSTTPGAVKEQRGDGSDVTRSCGCADRALHRCSDRCVVASHGDRAAAFVFEGDLRARHDHLEWQLGPIVRLGPEVHPATGVSGFLRAPDRR